MPRPHAGWLEDLGGERVIDGIAIGETWPTRFAEYRFILDTLADIPPGVVVDAGAGFNPEIHVLAYLLAGRGWNVIAEDANAESLKMPIDNHVVRYLEDLSVGWMVRGIAASAWVCVSTLEHMPIQYQMMALETAYEAVAPGGYALLTADNMPPERLNRMLRYGGFEAGPVLPFSGKRLNPNVGFAVGVKP